MRRVKPYESPFLSNPGKLPCFTPGLWHRTTFMAEGSWKRIETDCEMMLDFAVHKMIGTKGFTISYAPLGFRISSRDRVFKNADWAKHVAEKLHPISNDWGLYGDGSWEFPETTVKIWNYIFDVAEVQGAFLNELITPSDRISHPVLAY